MRDALPTVVNELGRLIAVPQNAATFDAFLRAFRSRRELSWSPEGPVLTPNPDAACAEGLESALRRYRGTVIPPSVGSAAADVVGRLQAALPHVTSDLAAIDFLGTVGRFPSDRSLGEHLLDALRQYADDDRRGMGRSPDPW